MASKKVWTFTNPVSYILSYSRTVQKLDIEKLPTINVYVTPLSSALLAFLNASHFDDKILEKLLLYNIHNTVLQTPQLSQR